MTPQEVAQIYRACEHLHKYGVYGFLLPWIKIDDFYANIDYEQDFSGDNEIAKNERILALLFYVAARGKL